MARERSKIHPAADTPRPSRRIHEEGAGKARDGAVCPSCGSSYWEGRWTSRAAPAGSYEQVCPACTRVETDDPGGILHVGGRFAQQHRDEIEGLLRNVETRERGEHPLKRIMAILEDEEDFGFTVTTTDAKLVESFGRALQKAYGGDLDRPRSSSEPGRFSRVRWLRD